MSKIDKIIQITADEPGNILGLSESGKLYILRYEKNLWEIKIESPVVDNSACEVNELNKYDIPPVSCSYGVEVERKRVEHCERVLGSLGKGTKND